MTQWHHSIVEAERPKKASERLADYFDLQKNKIKVIDDSRLYSRELLIKGSPGRYTTTEQIWRELKNSPTNVTRVMNVFAGNTHCTVTGILYSIKENKKEKIDEEMGSYAEKGEDYEGHSYLPGYFYHRHNFKMFGKTSDINSIDYENTYKPGDKENATYECPFCGSNDVVIDGWDGHCKKCNFEKSEPWFRYRYYRLAKGTDHDPPEEVRPLFMN